MITVPAGAIQLKIPRPLTEEEKARVTFKYELKHIIASAVRAEIDSVVSSWLNEQVSALKSDPYNRR